MHTVMIKLTDEQMTRLETLRSTKMSGERSDDPKTLEEVLFQVAERGIYTLEANRKQYQQKMQGAKMMKMMKDEKFQAENKEAFLAMMKAIG